MSSISELKKSLSVDPVVVKFTRISSVVRSAVNTETTEKEVNFLHASRKSRGLTSAKMSASILMDAIMTDMSARSRLIEIKTLVHRNQELISSALSAIKKHVMVRYQDELREAGSTKADRDAALDRIFQSATSLKSEMSSLEEQIDMVVRDIDQASFSLRNTTELLKMILDRKDSEF